MTAWDILPSRAGGARSRRAGRGSFLVWSVSTTTTARRKQRAFRAAGFLPDTLAGVPNRGAARRSRGGWGLGAPRWEPQSRGRRNRGWLSPPGSRKPARWRDAAPQEHLRSRACGARAAPGGKRGEVGTWARGSRGAGASETLRERPSLFGACRGVGVAGRHSTANLPASPRRAGGRERGARDPSTPRTARGAPGAHGDAEEPRRNADGPGRGLLGWGAETAATRSAFRFKEPYFWEGTGSCQSAREGAHRRRVMSADQLLANKEGLLLEKVAAAKATAAPRSLGGEGQVGEGRRDGCGSGSGS